MNSFRARAAVSSLALGGLVAAGVLIPPISAARQPRPPPALQQPLRTQQVMVVTAHHLATDAGVEILRHDGNAVDAAVAVGFALAVVYPAAGNLGGGGFMLIHQPPSDLLPRADRHLGRNIFIDYREEAPLAATPNMYLDPQGNVIPGASTIGYRAIAVPGSVAGLVDAERKYGRLTLSQVMAPAIRLASQGFVLTAPEAQELRDPVLARFPASHHLFQRDGNFYKAGDLFRQPELAQTLSRIAEAPGDFYRGTMAHQIADAIQAGGGIITPEDLAHYSVRERRPVMGPYRDYTIISAPPPSSGGITLLETLNILGRTNLTVLGDRTAPEMHLIVEAFRRAFMDRGAYLGDPDSLSIPVAALLNRKYADAWRATIAPDRATPSASLIRPAGFLPPPPAPPGALRESSDTTHYSVVDADGEAVSVTTTLNGGFGSGISVPALGFLLNDEMDDFAAKQGVPNQFGLLQGPANAIAPGKRPLSSMTPTIVLKNDQLAMVLGSPGGPRIITTVANIFLGVADQGLNIQQAVDAPRFHHQYLPDVLDLEPGFSPATLDGLRKMGYTLHIGGRWSDGECIAVDAATGALEGAHDPRQPTGSASGY